MPDVKNMVFLILVFAATATFSQGVWGLVSTAKVRRVMNHRLQVQEGTTNVGDLVIQLRKQRGLSANGERTGWLWLTDLITLSGVAFDPKRFALGGLACAVVVALAVLLLIHSILIAIPAGLAAAALGPLAYLKFMTARRAKKLSEQLPNALEVIVRSLEAGHPVPTAISLVGREMPDPIGSEFGMAADEIAFGATMEQAVGRIADRCRHPDVDLFAATIRLQERAGGNLTGLLKTIARTVRERHRMRLKIKAASSEGRASAMILTSAPFGAFAMLQIASPAFYGEVIHESFVRTGLCGFGVWMFIGNMIMRRMIDMRI